MNRAALLAVALVFASVSVAAGDLIVGYVDGVLEVREGNAWYELFIGDAVDASDEIRLAADSQAELIAGSATIRLSRPGTYDVERLLEGVGRTATAGIGRMVLGRISRMTGREDSPRQTVAGGARASEAVTQTGPTWAGGETVDELIVQGSELLSAGDLEDAYWVFQEAYEFAITDEEYARSLFYYGYASALVGRHLQAFDLLEELGPQPDTSHYASHVLVLGQLLLDSFAYEEAIEYLMPLAEADGEEVQDIQSAWLLLGIAHEGLGRMDLARDHLRRARDMDPESEAARAADQLLADL